MPKLATGFFCPDFKWSGFQMPGTGIRYNPNTASGSVLGGLLYSRHPNTGLSGIRMGTFRTLFLSGFWSVKRQILAAILFLPFENQTNLSGFRMVDYLLTI
jgi:hypothetical protein